MVDDINAALMQSVPVQGRLVTLRRFTVADAPSVLEYGSDPQTLEYLVWEGVADLEGARKMLCDCYLPNPGSLAIEENESGSCVGTIGILPEPAHEKASFGYVLARRCWNRGYMTEALTLTLALCFDILQLNRVESTHYSGNPASGKVMERCGMVREGFAEQEVRVKGRFHDVYHYGITRRRWLELRGT